VIEAGAAVNVGGGIVITVPVGVNVGMRETGTSALVKLEGGHVFAARSAAGILEVCVPTCQGWYRPFHELSTIPIREQKPMAVRGSLGIHPLRRPSWYDHAGISTRPRLVSPICKVN